MKRGLELTGPLAVRISFFKAAFLSFVFFTVFFSLALRPLGAVELDAYPPHEFSRDPLVISFFREERPSFYWVNIGLPDVFFTGVKRNSTSPLVYAIRSMEH